MDGHTVLRCVFQFYSMSDSLSIPQVRCRYIHGRTHAPRTLHQPLSTNTLPCEALTSCNGLQSSTRFPEQVLFPFIKLIILIPPQSHQAPSTVSTPRPRSLNGGFHPNCVQGFGLLKPGSATLFARTTVRRWSSRGTGRISSRATGSVPMRLCRWHFKRHISVSMVSVIVRRGWFLGARLYVCTGRIECVYEPAMTKAFLHGRTEAIRSVQPESVEFTKVRDLLVL